MSIGPVDIDVPEGKDPIMFVWGEMVPKIGVAASRYSQAVYEHTTLELDVFEAARLRVAQINGCVFCLDWRTERDGETVADTFAEAVLDWQRATELSDRARLAAEYAELFVSDHHSIDDAFWKRMKSQYSATEITELSMCLGAWLAFGRLNHVLGLDVACVLPGH